MLACNLGFPDDKSQMPLPIAMRLSEIVGNVCPSFLLFLTGLRHTRWPPGSYLGKFFQQKKNPEKFFFSTMTVTLCLVVAQFYFPDQSENIVGMPKAFRP